MTLDVGSKFYTEKKQRRKLDNLSKKPVSSAFENKVEKGFRKEFNEILQKEYLDQKCLEQEEKVNIKNHLFIAAETLSISFFKV